MQIIDEDDFLCITRVVNSLVFKSLKICGILPFKWSKLENECQGKVKRSDLVKFFKSNLMASKMILAS